MVSARLSVRETFLRALEAQDRGCYLDQACGQDVKLRARVEELLSSHDEAGDFLSPQHPEPSPENEGPGALIGHYQLIRLIGQGGFGDVYLAEQQEPVHRQVALKIIKLGMDTRAVIARFEAERQALALMDHPNIATVLDAGATENGRPYFAMELVRGIPINQYCDENNLSTKERLGLFIDVCHAVQHAHQKGIIHRDIKPMNVMVTQRDGKAVPKIIDFGVAKATQQRLTEKTVFTEQRQLVGTPEYMSPEQATFCEADVDTRSDIYSLGVLLYELLVGTTPFDAEALRSHGYDEICRVIRESDPPTPSKRLSGLDDAKVTDISKRRHVEPAALQRLLRGDLDWIVMKTLEKDRTRRYETAHGLVRDIERHLHDEPVRARPPSKAYRLQKFVHKHRGPVAAVVAVIAALTLGLIGTSVGFVRASGEREMALRERDRALAILRFARTQNDDLLYQAADYTIYAPGDDEEELKFRSLPILDWDCASVMESHDGQVGSAFLWLRGGRPEVIGAIYRSDWDETVVTWHELQSLALTPLVAEYRGQRVWTPAEAGIDLNSIPGSPPPAATNEKRLSQMCKLAEQFAASNQSRQGWATLTLKPEPLYRYGREDTNLIDGALFVFLDFTEPEVLLLLEARRGDSATRWHYALARLSWRALAVQFRGSSVWEDPAPKPLDFGNILENAEYRARTFIDYVPAAIPRNQEGDSLRKLATAYEEYGLALRQSGDVNKAERIAAEAQRLWAKLESEIGCDLSIRLRRALTSSNHAILHRRVGRIGKAIEAAHEAVRFFTQLTRDFPDDYRFQRLLGSAQADLGHLDEAANAFSDAARLHANLAASCDWNCNAAIIQARISDWEAYRATCTRLLQRYDDTRDPEIATYVVRACHWGPRAMVNRDRIVELAELASPIYGRAEHEVDLSIALYRAGRHREAADRLERQLAQWGAADREHLRAQARLAWSMALHRLGDGRRARAELDGAIAWIRQTLPNADGKPVPRIAWFSWRRRVKLNLLREEAETMFNASNGSLVEK